MTTTTQDPENKRFRAGDVYRALGLSGTTIPPEMEGTFTVHVTPAYGPTCYREYRGPLIVRPATGAYAKHRIFIPCACGREVPFGRIAQHRCKPAGR